MLQLPGLLPTPPHIDEYRRIAYSSTVTCAWERKEVNPGDSRVNQKTSLKFRQMNTFQNGRFRMKECIMVALSVVLLLGTSTLALAGENPLKAQEKKVNDEFAALIPADKIIDVNQFYQVYQDVMAGKKKAYLIDVRTYPEFDAFHIEGTDHINSGYDVRPFRRKSRIPMRKFTSGAVLPTEPNMSPDFCTNTVIKMFIFLTVVCLVGPPPGILLLTNIPGNSQSPSTENTPPMLKIPSVSGKF